MRRCKPSVARSRRTHGIGLEKKAWLPVSRTAEEIALMRLLKSALDPLGILNPGKVVDAVSAA